MIEFKSFHVQNALLWKDVTFSFEPGVTVVQGPNRSGKCLIGSTIINTQDGFVRLDEMQIKKGYHSRNGIVDTPRGRRNFSHVYRDKGQVITVTTHNGFSISGTPEHPVMVLTPELKFKWRRLDKLRIGDHILSKTKDCNPMWGSQQVSIDQARLLGWWVANGRNGEICTGDKELAIEVLQTARRVLGNNTAYSVTKKGIEYIRFGTQGKLGRGHKALWQKFLTSFGMSWGSASTKTIPARIKQAPRSVVHAFLSAYFSMDSGANGNNLQLTSASEKLSNDLHILLYHGFNILGTKSKIWAIAHNSRSPKERPYWVITLCGTNASSFVKTFTDAKVSRVFGNRWLSVDSASHQEFRTSYLPYVIAYQKRIKDTLRRVACRHKGDYYETVTGGLVSVAKHEWPFQEYVTSKGPLQHATMYAVQRLDWNKYITAKQVAPDYMKRLQKIVTKDCHFERVVSVEKSQKQKTVYDITVPDGHAFIANCLTSHNTLLFRLLSQALWGAGNAKRGTDLSKLPLGSSVTLDLISKEVPYTITAKPTSLSISMNGESLKLSGKTEGLNRLRTIVPVTSELYHSTVHVAGNVSSLLQILPATARLDWLLSAYRLDEGYDHLLEQVNKQLSQASESALLYRASSEELLLAETKLLPPAILKKKTEKLNHIMATVAKSRERVWALNGAIDLMTKIKKLGRVKGSKVNIRKLEKRAAIALKYERDYASWKQSHKMVSNVLSLRTKAQKDVEHLRPVSATKEQVRLFSILEKLRNRRAERLKAWERQKEVEKRLQSLGSAPKGNLEDMKRLLSSLQFEKEALQKIVETSTSQAECSYCGADLCSKNHRKKVKASKLRLSALTEEIQKAEKACAYLSLQTEITLPNTTPDVIKIVNQSHAKLATKVKKRAKLAKAMQLLKSVKSPDLPPKPKQTEKESYASLQDRINKAKEDKLKKSQRDTFYKLLKEQSKKVGLSVKEMKLSNLRRVCEEVMKKLDVLIRKESALLAEVQEAENAVKTVQKLKAKVDELKNKARDVQILSELSTAFGKKGLRVDIAESLVSSFRDELNELAKIMWTDGSKFELTIENGGLKILLFRKGQISDLSTLSGSEERVWKLISAIALTRLLPSNQRVDFMILDELESMLDERSRALFAKELIPEIRRTVPKIIIVSPLDSSALPVAADRHFRVKNTGKVSSLVPS